MSITDRKRTRTATKMLKPGDLSVIASNQTEEKNPDFAESGNEKTAPEKNSEKESDSSKRNISESEEKKSPGKLLF